MAEQAVSMARGGTPVAIALGGLAALAVAIGIGRFAFTPLLPMMQEDAGLSVAAGGWLASANYAGYLLGALWAAVTPARAAVAIRAGIATIGIATLAMSVEGGIAGWAVLRFVAGVASAWVLIHVSAWSLECLAATRRPLLEGVVFSGVGVGILVTGLFCAALMAAHAGSATAWRDLGLLSLATTLVTWNVFTSSSGALRPARAQRRWSLAHARLAFAYGTFGFGYIIPATFIPVLAKELLR
ncbi:MAG: YbfB/YjiJ family MFS transporter, partial [Burkholderiales bacterium]